jgi:tetratricopeptide (TPR) repeat protein
VSEPKETESGSEAQAEATELPASATRSDELETSAGKAEGASGAEGESTPAEAEPSAEDATPKKKKKKAREAEPETIKDRNARVRAEAAEKRRTRREREQGTAPRRNLDASEVMDDALARSTHAAAGFVTKHFNKVQWVILAGLGGWIAWEVYSWRHDRTAEKATDALFKALAADTGKVDASGDTAEDSRRTFATEGERLKTAKREYLLASASGADTAALADLGAAGVAYDLGEFKEAQSLYEKVRKHPRFATDSDIKGRTLEGLGMTLEAQKDEDGALKAFRELANMDSANLAALGLYHQARLLKAQGKQEDALKLLDKAGTKLEALKESPALIRYVGNKVLELLEAIDPKKAGELTQKLISTEAKKQMDALKVTGPGGAELSAEMQQKLNEIMEKQRQNPPEPMPGPLRDAPAPEAPQDAPAPANSGAQ